MAMVFNLVLIGLAITLDPLPLTAFIAVLPYGTELRRRGEQTGRQ